MPSANKMTTPVAVDLPEIQGRYAELDGYTAGFESYPEDVDPAPLFHGCRRTVVSVRTGGSFTAARSPFDGTTTRRPTAPVMPTTPHPAICR